MGLNTRALFDKRKEEIKVIAFIVITFVISRLTMYVVSGFTFSNWSPMDSIHRYNTWDAYWYRDYVVGILTDHYYSDATGMAPWTFFPLYPLIVSFFYKLFNQSVDIFLLGSIISTIFFGIAEFIGYKYIMLTRKSLAKAYYCIGLMNLGIFSFYFTILYTESLFLLLLILCFYFLKKKNYLAMGLCGALLSATRGPGIMFVFVVLVNCIMEYFAKTKKGNRSFKEFVITHVTNEKLILGTFAIPLGFFSYALFLYNRLGDQMAFAHFQRAWGRFEVGMFAILKERFIDNFPPTYLELVFVISVLFVFGMVFRKRYDEAIFPAIVIVLNTNSALDSLARYMAGTFVMTLFFIDELTLQRKTTKYILIALDIIIEILFMYGWITEVATLM